MIENHIESNTKIDWSIGLSGACLGGNLEVVKFIIGQGLGFDIGWVYGLIHACKGGHMNIVNFMIEKGTKS